MADIKSQKMKFIQACTPVIDDGDYCITVGQNVNLATVGKKIPQKKQYFSVKGPRFSLDTKTIDSVFPPKNKSGCYANCLPHIVLKRKTLPWEREIFHDKKAVRVEHNGAPADVKPWLAVLAFDSIEAPEIKKSTAKDILSPGENVVAGKITLDTHVGESESTSCLTIDVKSTLFNNIVPAVDELKYLSQARFVDMEHKKSDESNDGYYSVVIGNRFPLASKDGEKNVSHLVSLEGLGEYLPGAKPITDPNVSIRLISLASWQYSVIAEKFDFKLLIENLSPATTLKINSPPGASSDIKNALDMGYTAMNHNLRDGEHTASWYRGPLVPLKLDGEKIEPGGSADSFNKYNPETGLFDISYSAAWQIGRLLALQNKNFALALFRWRRGNNQNAAFLKMRDILKTNLSKVLKYEDKEVNVIGDTLLRNLTLNYIHNDLGKKIMPDNKNSMGLLGKHGDPTGMLKNSSEIPGLLSLDKLDEIVSSGGDIVNKIVHQARENDR